MIVLCFLLFVDFSSAESTEELQATFACNGEITLFGTTDRKVWKDESENPANMSMNFTVNPGTQVLAVRCRNFKSKPWIIGSVSNGLVTGNRWKCFSLPQEEIMNNRRWTKPNFDDSRWAQAVSNISSRKDEGPWLKFPDISDEAFWISTASEDHSRLFCRHRVSEVALKWVKSNGIFQATLDDVDHALFSHPRSQHEVSDVMQCFQKCQDDYQCLSFNFEYTTGIPINVCELNGVTKDQDPKNFMKRPGYTYYEKVG